jgi:hypothetical protein
MKTPRLLAAIGLAPLCLITPFILVALVIEDGGILLIVSIFALLFAYVGLLFIGVPIFLLLQRYGLNQWWQVTIAGALAPSIATWSSNNNAVLTFALSGAALALVAWFIAFYRLRDDDEQIDGIK